METSQKIISECVDAALSKSELIEKTAFYKLLKESYGIDAPKKIGSSFGSFHEILKQQTGPKHYEIERQILRILKDRTRDGIYGKIEEIAAFNTITNALIKDTKESVNLSKKFISLEHYATELKGRVDEQDRQLKLAERMTAIGETAAMVGHDIRNPLQAIVCDVFLIESALSGMPEGKDKEEIEESLEEIQKNLEYINKIVQDLQDYARPLRPTLKEMDLGKVFDDVLVRKAVPKSIEVSCRVDADARMTTVDPDLLKRVLANLVNNAVQAMHEKGKLTIRGFKDGNFITVTVEDTGPGIPEETRPKLFTPLFTTKSKGQGFGLAVVRRLTEALGGTVSFESEVGKGTTFIVRLPQKGARP